MDCKVDDCEKSARARGLCDMHYRRLMRHGATDKATRQSKPKPPCSVDNCDSISLCRGWCRKHYTRWYETGSLDLGVRDPVAPPPPPKKRPIEDRFWEKVLKGDNHWLWLGSKTKLGYGMIWDYDRQGHSMAHRVSWEIANGKKIAEGLVIDHLCRTPSCVNPSHLEVVTVSVNTARGLAGEVGGRINRNKTHCPQGHLYSTDNTYYYNEGKTRVCRTCAIEKSQARRKRITDGN